MADPIDYSQILLGSKHYLPGNKRPAADRIFKRRYLNALALDPEDFNRDPKHCCWIYAGPLEDVTEWYAEWHPDIQFLHWDHSRVAIQANGGEDFSVGHSKEDAWRKLIGKSAFLKRSRLAELADPDENLGFLLTILGYLDSDDPDDWENSYYADGLLSGRWIEAVAQKQTALPLGEWLKEMTNNG